jgi:hypothetical protein
MRDVRGGHVKVAPSYLSNSRGVMCFSVVQGDLPVATPNYGYEKRQRELEKKRKKAEKERAKAARKNEPQGGTGGDMPEEADSATGEGGAQGSDGGDGGGDGD